MIIFDPDSHMVVVRTDLVVQEHATTVWMMGTKFPISLTIMLRSLWDNEYPRDIPYLPADRVRVAYVSHNSQLVVRSSEVW